MLLSGSESVDPAEMTTISEIFQCDELEKLQLKEITNSATPLQTRTGSKRRS